MRGQLLQALDTLEKTKDFAQLPALFATLPGDTKELAYLNDALETSLDQLIRDASPDARRLLWIIALANEPVALGMLKSVWSGEDGPQQAQLRQIKQMLDNLPQLPPELQEQFKAMPPEFRALLDALPEQAQRPDPAPLLRHLVSVGLVTEERDGPDDDNPELACHELVRERIRAWMERVPQDRGDLSADSIRLAYAERLEAVFKQLRHQNMSAALEAGSRAIVYCVQAEAWERLGSFASGVVTSSSDPRLLEDLIPHLQTAAESAPEGKPRWSCLSYLADALWRGGRPDASLPFYEQAATLARSAAETSGAGSQQAWEGLAVITGNWANALGDVGQLEAAHQRLLEAAETSKAAGRPLIYVLAKELEALRIDIMQGQAKTALPEIEERLEQVAIWWQQHRAGQAVPEAPDAEYLARSYIGALDIARDADYAREDWESALKRINATLEIERALQRPAEEIGLFRFNRANVLMNLGQFGEARTELEACLPVFQNNPAINAKVYGSLADLFNRQQDLPQAISLQRRALALHDCLPDPVVRAISHNNLANYLERLATPSALAELSRHQLAALLYRLVAGLGQDLLISLRNYAVRFRRARESGTELAVPSVADLLADPAFHPLQQWLDQRQVDIAELQAAVDQRLEQVRQAAL